MEGNYLSTYLLDRFEMLESLTEENWDGDGADPINLDLVSFGKKIIINIVEEGYPEPFIGATPAGTMDIIWDKKIYCVLSEPDQGGLLCHTMPEFEEYTFDYPDYTASSAVYLSKKVIDVLEVKRV